MAFLNGTADIPTFALTHFGRPEEATACSGRNVLYDLADYIRTSTLSDVAHDTVSSAWGSLAPVWLRRQQRIRLLEKMMKEVDIWSSIFVLKSFTDVIRRQQALRATKHAQSNSMNYKVTTNGN
jgi:hypothetical protein